MPTLTYRQFAWSIQNRVPLGCTLGGGQRIFCPITLGHEGEIEVAHVWQTGGASSGPLPGWRTFHLDKVAKVRLHPGEWQWEPGKGLKRPRMAVDYDAYQASPYNPTRSLGDLRGQPFPG